jgi:uncharacterized membrane protein
VICASTILCPAEKLYAFWRQLENLPQVMPHLASVTQTSQTSSRSVAKGTSRRRLEWDAEIIVDTHNQLIAWRTRGADVPAHACSVRFEPSPGNEGTDVTVSLEYDPPEKKTELTSLLFGAEPGARIADDLRRLKTLIEAGGISRIGTRTLLTPAKNSSPNFRPFAYAPA